VAALVDVVGKAVVDVGGGVQADPRVVVLVVVVLDELIQESACVLQDSEPQVTKFETS
jgi:hypothetical protein